MALTITARDITLEAPELECNAIDSDRMAKAIADAALQVNVGAVSTQARADRLGVLLVCHELTLWLQRRKGGVGGAAQSVGPLTSVSVGGISKSFASTTDGLSEAAKALSSTSYGREYSRLVRLWVLRGGVS